jgi:hypothetical protein
MRTRSLGDAMAKQFRPKHPVSLQPSRSDVEGEPASPRRLPRPLPSDFLQFLSEKRGISCEEALRLLGAYADALQRSKGT